MEISIENQLIIIAYSFILGLIFGAGYDIIRIVHLMLSGFRLRQPILFLLDLVYMLLMTVGCSVFAYAFNHGVLRLFILVPMGAGFAVYYNTAGRLVMFFSEALIRAIRTVLHYTVVLPVQFFLRCLRMIGTWVFRYTVGAVARRMVEMKRRRRTNRQKRLLKSIVRI